MHLIIFPNKGKFVSFKYFAIFISKIKSIQSKCIRFKQQNEIITSSGWIDFNENSIGLSTRTENEEVFTEIRYSSLTDWYMKGNLFIFKE